MTRLRWLVALAVGFSAVSAPAVAQPGPPKPPAGGTFNVVRDGAPVANVNIFMYSDTPKLLGSTSATGMCDVSPATLASANVSVPPGTRLQVWQRVCQDGKIQVILVPFGVTNVEQKLGCADKNAAAGDSCRCEQTGVVSWGANMAIDLGSVGSAPTFFFDEVALSGGLTFTGFPDAEEPCTTISSQLTALNYNTVGCTSDGSGTGFTVGGGAYRHFNDWTGFYIGASYSKLGNSSHDAGGTRINVPGSSSNLDYWQYDGRAANLFEMAFGPDFAIGKIHVTPTLNVTHTGVDGMLNARLLAGPVGTTAPTTQVATDEQQYAENGWSLGWGTRVRCDLKRMTKSVMAAFAEVHASRINDAFAADDPGRKPATFRLRGLKAGLEWRYKF